MAVETITACVGCNESFQFDFEIGLNVKLYDPEHDARHVFFGGEFPCCPHCGARNAKPYVSTVNVGAVIRQVHAILSGAEREPGAGPMSTKNLEPITRKLIEGGNG